MFAAFQWLNARGILAAKRGTTLVQMLEIRLLGGFQLNRDGATVGLRSRTAQSLLAYLALSAGTAHRREKLAGLLWPEADDDNARGNLRHALWRIRKAIDPDEPAIRYLLSDDLAVWFNPAANYWLDAANLTNGGASLQQQMNALALYRGELLPGFYDEWVSLERERLDALFQQAMQRLIDGLVQEQQWSAVVEWGERWISFGDAPEPGYRALMLAHAERGDRARVAVLYHRLREALFNELGVEPSAATQRLYERLSRDSALDGIGETGETAVPPPEHNGTGAGEDIDHASFVPRKETERTSVGRRTVQPSTTPRPRRTSERAHSRMPYPLSNLVGRANEVAVVTRLLRVHRLVTLCGVAGVGKTRLAVSVAQSVSAGYADGAVFIDLAQISDWPQVVSAIAERFSMRDPGDANRLEQLRDILRENQLLLVLDNFEHVLPAAQDIAELLLDCPRLSVLATSRAPLRLVGEQVFEVPPLRFPAAHVQPTLNHLSRFGAIQLFVERARAARSDFRLMASNAQTITEICRRLDGLPLAIELAAAHIGSLAPADILARISRRLQFLTAAPRDVPDRHRTLRGALEWSYALLTPNDARVFRQLGVFAGNWTIAAASVVCACRSESETLEVLSSLVQQRLVQVGERDTGETCYWLLDTIREYALQLLSENGELALAYERHTNYFIDLVRILGDPIGAYGPDGNEYVDKLKGDHANLREVMRRARQSGDFDMALSIADTMRGYWYLNGHFAEARHTMSELLALAPRDAAASKQLSLRFYVGFYSALLGDYGRAEEFAQEVAAFARESGETGWLGNARNLQGIIASHRGDYSTARVCYEEGLALRRESGAPAISLATVVYNLAWLDCQEGLFDDARIRGAEALRLMQGRAFAGSTLAALRTLGFAELGAGNVRSARHHFEEALEAARFVPDFHFVADVLEGMARVELASGRIRPAAMRIREGLLLCYRLSERIRIVTFLELAAEMAASNGAIEVAQRIAGAADALRDTLGAQLYRRREREPFLSLVKSWCATAGEARSDRAWTTGRHDTLIKVVDLASATLGATGRKRSASILTSRELEVAILIGKRLTNRQIAADLGISVSTVERYVANILNRLGLRSRGQIASRLREPELGEQPQPDEMLARSVQPSC